MVKFNNCLAQHDEVRQGYKRFANSSTIHLDFENKSYNNDEIPSKFHITLLSELRLNKS